MALTSFRLLFSMTALLLHAAPVGAQTVYTDDIIVQGQTCIGIDCPSAPLISGTDTLQLNANNTRIFFQAPVTNFRLAANENTNAGDEEFRIDQQVSASAATAVVLVNQTFVQGTLQGDGRLLITDASGSASSGQLDLNADPNADLTDVVTTLDQNDLIGTYLPAGVFTPFVGNFYSVNGDQTLQNAAGDPAQIAQSSTGYVSAVTFSVVNNSVALGRGTVAAANTVSVGARGNERRITGVATPLEPNDLVPLSYFQDGLGTQINAQTEQITAAEKRNRDVAAMSAAFSALQANPRGSGELALSVGFGYYDAQTAGAVGVVFSPTPYQQVRIGVSSTGDSRPQLNLSGRIQW